MPPITVDLKKALALRDAGALFVDARSPAEYAEATIPGAINVPIFNNEERARVGTFYKQQGREIARTLAIELVSPKIPRLIAEVEAARGGRGREVIVFCWRGGMRSKALTSLLELAGIATRQLVGGHKAFRAHVRQFFEQGQWGRLLVFRGLTGVGKTRLLKRLQLEGYPVLDLEGLAHHRGSAFGSLGLPPQPTQKAFEAVLWDALSSIPPGGYALAEGESKNIGKLVIPPKVFADLQLETSIWIEASLDYRVQVILEDYPALEELKESFIAPIQALKRRLGRESVDRLLELLKTGQWGQLVRDLMVLYYDPLYNHTKPSRRIEVQIEPEAEGIIRLKQVIDGMVLEGAGPEGRGLDQSA